VNQNKNFCFCFISEKRTTLAFWCVDLWVDWCVDLWVDLWVDWCVDWCVDLWVDWCVDLWVDLWVDWCVDLWVDFLCTEKFRKKYLFNLINNTINNINNTEKSRILKIIKNPVIGLKNQLSV
jgi:hypothetical protein